MADPLEYYRARPIGQEDPTIPKPQEDSPLQKLSYVILDSLSAPDNFVMGPMGLTLKGPNAAINALKIAKMGQDLPNVLGTNAPQWLEDAFRFLRAKYPKLSSMPKETVLGKTRNFPGLYDPYTKNAILDADLIGKFTKEGTTTPIKTIAHEDLHAVQGRNLSAGKFWDKYNKLAEQYWPEEFRKRLDKGGPFFFGDSDTYYKHPMEAQARQAGETAQQAMRLFMKVLGGGR